MLIFRRLVRPKNVPLRYVRSKMVFVRSAPHRLAPVRSATVRVAPDRLIYEINKDTYIFNRIYSFIEESSISSC